MTIKLTAPIKNYMDSINGNDIAALGTYMAIDAHIHDIGEKSISMV
jgi:hypothetical protein